MGPPAMVGFCFGYRQIIESETEIFKKKNIAVDGTVVQTRAQEGRSEHGCSTNDVILSPEPRAYILHRIQ
jgi:hypothetical protein